MKLFILCFLFSVQSFAQVLFDSPNEQRLNWSVGTSATYKIYNHFSKKGQTYTASVTKVSNDKAWIEQTFLGKHFVTIYDVNTGKILENWVDGKPAETYKEQPGEWTVLDSQVTTITVPAGTYRAQYTHKKSFNFFQQKHWTKADNDSSTPFTVLSIVGFERFSSTKSWFEYTLLSENIVR